MGWLAVAAGAVAYKGVVYAGQAIGGAVGYQMMRNTVTNFSSAGAAVAGPIGGAVGNFVGRGAAGLAVNTARDQARVISKAVTAVADAGLVVYNENLEAKRESNLKDSKPSQLKTINNKPAVINAAGEIVSSAMEEPKNDGEKKASPEKSKSWGPLAWKTAQAAAAIGVGVGAAVVGVGVLAPLAIAAVSALPNVLNAISETTIDPNLSLRSDVLLPFATEMAIGGVAALAGGVAAYNYIESAHDARIVAGGRIGAAVDSIMPSGVKGFFTTAGRAVGTVDAGRHAMSDAVVDRAIKVATNTQDIVEVGLTIGVAIANAGPAETNEEPATWGQVACKAGLVMGGVAAAGLFVVLAPEAAAVAGGAALLNVAAPLARWAKAKMASTSDDESVEAKDDVATEETSTSEEVVDLQATEVSPELLTSLTKTNALATSRVFESICLDSCNDLTNNFVMMPTAAAA